MTNMNQFYPHPTPLLPRRATEPVTLAPTASMIDPSLENTRMQHAQLPHNYARLQMQHNAAAIQSQPNGFSNQTSDNSMTHDRNLPPKEVSENTIEDAYVQFIMYCNPSIPLDADTTELRKGFNLPPRSDNKSFSSYRLFQLISQLENNEIKNWSELVIELGVSLPAIAKAQSPQKIQQYAVRLKVKISLSLTVHY